MLARAWLYQSLSRRQVHCLVYTIIEHNPTCCKLFNEFIEEQHTGRSTYTDYIMASDIERILLQCLTALQPCRRRHAPACSVLR